jgi:uncharacterized membrane protein YqjE
MTATDRANPATGTDEPSIGALVKDVSTHLSTVLRGEVELAKIELKASVKNLGTGAAGFVAALVLIVLAFPIALIALAEGLVAAHIWRWAAYLIVFGLMLVLAGLAAFLGWRKVRRVRPPKRTIETTKSTVAALRHSATSSSPSPDAAAIAADSSGRHRG